MLSNYPHQPIDFFTHEICSEGEPKWLYLDPGIFQPPEGTTHIAVDFGEGDAGAALAERGIREVCCYEEARDIVDWRGYFRLPTWPKNVFRSWSDLGPNRPNSDEHTDEVNDLYYYNLEYTYDGSNDEGLDPEVAWANAELFIPTVEFCIPHLRGLRTFSIQANAIEHPEALSRLLQQLGNDATAIPQWLWVDDGECDGNHHGDTLTLNIFDEETLVAHGDITHTPSLDSEAYRVLYHRNSSWPEGIFKLVESYTLVGGVPKPPSGFILLPSHGVINVPPRIGLDYVRGSDIINVRGLTHDLRTALPDAISAPWYTWSHDGGVGAGTLHVIDNQSTGLPQTHLEQDVYVDRTGEVFEVEGLQLPEGSKVITSMYRHERWANNIWCRRWNADGTPEYGPDAMGYGAPSDEDETTPEEPLSDIEAFNFQTWVQLDRWQPGLPAHAATGQMFVKRVGETGALLLHPVDSTRAPYASWDNSSREWGATYYRLRHFPDGLYRRVDNFTAVEENYISRNEHEDAPSASEIGAPWHSAYLRDWVAAMESEIGRPIYPSPELGTPWIRFRNPEATALEARTNTCREGDAVIQTSRLRSDPFPEHMAETLINRGTLQTSDGTDQGTQYRTGANYRFDPCSLRYGQQPPGRGDKQPLWHFLSKVEKFFREYSDPNVIDDVAAEMYSKVSREKTRIQPELDRKIRDINSLRDSLRQQFEQLHELQSKMDMYEHMSLGKYQSLLRPYAEYLSAQGELRQSGTKIIFKMNVFEIEGQPIGPLIFTMEMGNQFTLKVKLAAGSPNASDSQYIHPHIALDGRICWGNGTEAIAEWQRSTNPLMYLKGCVDILRDGYFPGDSYCKISAWRPVPHWFCEYCDEDHRLGDEGEENCPNQCPTCSEQVNWGRHSRCVDHDVCWSPDDREGCPTCAEEQEANSDSASAAE